jgi:hypothetical protein
MTGAPIVVEFVAGARVERAAEVVPRLPIVGNGPPGTLVVFADARRVPLPTAQIASIEDAGDAGPRIGFAGMTFQGLVEGQLMFLLVLDRAPTPRPARGQGSFMTLEPYMVASVSEDGHVIWPSIH